MAKLVILLSCIALFQAVTAFQCYSCQRESCMKDMKEWQKVNCEENSATPNHPKACLKQVFNDKMSGKPMTIRKCVIAEKQTNGQLKYTCGNMEGTEVSCDICQGELCNSAPSMFNSQYAMIVAVLAFLIPKFLMH